APAVPYHPRQAGTGGGTPLSAPRDSAAPVACRPVTQARRCVRLHPYFESPIRPCETPRPSLTWVPVLMPAPFGCPCEIAAFTHAALRSEERRVGCRSEVGA